VRSGQHPDGLGQIAVTSHQPMVVAVGPDQVSQHLGISPIRLGPPGPMTFPVAAGGKRVARHHLVASRDQGTNQQPTIQLDAHHHLSRLGGVICDQRVQLGDAGDPIGHPAAAEHGAGLVQYAQLVVGFGPVHADKDHPASSPSPPGEPRSPAAT
jgi:hypothetical protein